MNKEFVPYQESLELKELGFDEDCLAYYDGNSNFYPMGTVIGPETIYFGIFNPTYQYKASTVLIAAPLFQQTFRWFRKKYRLDSFCRALDYSGNSYWKISKLYEDGNIKGYSGFCNSYEQAELECVRQLIKIVKENENISNQNK